MRLCICFKKSPKADVALDHMVAIIRAAVEIPDIERCLADRAISRKAQYGGLHLSPKNRIALDKKPLRVKCCGIIVPIGILKST